MAVHKKPEAGGGQSSTRGLPTKSPQQSFQNDLLGHTGQILQGYGPGITCRPCRHVSICEFHPSGEGKGPSLEPRRVEWKWPQPAHLRATELLGQLHSGLVQARHITISIFLLVIRSPVGAENG